MREIGKSPQSAVSFYRSSEVSSFFRVLCAIFARKKVKRALFIGQAQKKYPILTNCGQKIEIRL